MFAPYLAGGEQGALWDPTLRGAVSGLTLRHTASDLARAFMEGVCFEIRRCLEVLSESTPIRHVVVSGHLTDHPSSLQMLADILGYPVAEVRDQSPAAIGAALLARRILQKGAAEGRRGAALEITRPDPQAADAYRALYAAYLVRAAKCA